jgi:hypothetical protein
LNRDVTFHDEDLCLANSATTNTILKEKKYFEYLTLTKANVTTILGVCLGGRCDDFFFQKKHVFFAFMKCDSCFKQVILLKKSHHTSHPNTH